MTRKVAGIIIVLTVLGVGALIFLEQRGIIRIPTLAPRKAVTVEGLIGSEKSNFLDDPHVASLLRRKYGLAVEYRKAGSIEQVRGGMSEGQDFLWPSSQVALEIFLLHGGARLKDSLIFNSPMVLYSWDAVAEALLKGGFAEAAADGSLQADLAGLVKLARSGRSWSELGLPQLYGAVGIVSTDPTKSNSGNLFAGMLANVLKGGVVDEGDIDPLLPEIKAFFNAMGYMQHSTGTLFEAEFLKKGMGQYPLIVGYENQIVEFSLMNPALWAKVKDRLRILYPRPTVWSSHPLIALTQNGEQLMEALTDPEIQELAWRRHGFRTGMSGVDNDPSSLGIRGLAADVTAIMPLPQPRVMELILESLEAGH